MRAGAVTLPATYTPANEQTWSWRSVVYQNGCAAYLVHYMAPRRLLRPRHERPRRRSATDKRNELAAFHSSNSSARMSRGNGTSTPSVLAVCRLTSNSTLAGCSTGNKRRRPSPGAYKKIGDNRLTMHCRRDGADERFRD